MQNARPKRAALLTAGALLLSALATPVAAQCEYTHQDLNSPAARALRTEIINRAIIRQATHGRSSRSHRAARHRSRSHTAKKSHRG